MDTSYVNRGREVIPEQTTRSAMQNTEAKLSHYHGTNDLRSNPVPLRVDADFKLGHYPPPRQLNRYPPPLFENGKSKNNLLLVKVIASGATRHGDGEMLRLWLRALLALHGRRDPLGRWITTRWTGGRGARFVT